MTDKPEWDGIERRHQPDTACVQFAETAAENAARRVLAELGLDAEAASDIKEMRKWLDGFRGAKKAAGKQTVVILTTAFWICLVAGVVVWAKTKFHMGG